MVGLGLLTEISHDFAHGDLKMSLLLIAISDKIVSVGKGVSEYAM